MTEERPTRQEHIAWCKQRALAYLDLDVADPTHAVTSMVSDLGKHPETADMQGWVGRMGIDALLSSTADVRRFIEGFR